MWLFWLPILFAIVSSAFYHFIQKSIPGSVNPVISMLATYFMAFIGCLLVLPFYPLEPGQSFWDSVRKLNWTSFALGFTIVGVELGFLITYRVGWNISIASIFANVAVALLLIPVGLLVFKEHINLLNVAGIILCAAGLVLVNIK